MARAGGSHDQVIALVKHAPNGMASWALAMPH